MKNQILKSNDQEDNEDHSGKQLPDFFTIKELSAYSRIGTKTLYQLVDGREIEFVNIGRKIVIKRADFEKWFEKNKKAIVPQRPSLPEKLVTKPMFSFD